MMNEFGDNLVERSLAMLGEETDEIWAASRKARLMASIANLKTDAGEQTRIDSIAADAGIEAAGGDGTPPAEPGTLRHLRLSPAASTRREAASESGGSVCTVDSSGLCGSGKRSTRRRLSCLAGWCRSGTCWNRCRRSGAGSPRWQVS